MDLVKKQLPIMSLNDVLEGRFENLGIRKKEIMSVKPLELLDKAFLTQKQLDQLKFIPKIEVVSLKDDPNLWFRIQGGSWAMVFILLPGDMVLLTAEYVTGADIILVGHCAGMLEKGEPIDLCAKREAKEESGIILEKAISLSGNGLPVSSRKSGERVFPFLGIPLTDKNGNAVFCDCKPDDTEDIKPFLMHLRDYWEFINAENFSNSVAGRDCGYAGLRALGRLQCTFLR